MKQRHHRRKSGVAEYDVRLKGTKHGKPWGTATFRAEATGPGPIRRVISDLNKDPQLRKAGVQYKVAKIQKVTEDE